MIQIGKTYEIRFDDITNESTSESDVVINGLNASYGTAISKKIEATAEQKNAVEMYVGKEIVSVYELTTNNTGNDKNLGGVVSVSIPCEDAQNCSIVWLKDELVDDDDTDTFVVPVPMTTSVVNNCLVFETGHFSKYAVVRDKTTSTGGGSAGGGAGGGIIAPVEPTTPTTPVDIAVKEEVKPTVSEGTAKAVITPTNVDKMLEDLDKEEKAATDAGNAIGESNVNIAVPKSTDNVSKVEVEVPASTLQKVADKSGTSLNLETEVGDIKINNEALGSIAKQAGDEKVEISAERIESIPENIKETVGENVVMVDVTIKTSAGKISTFGNGTIDIKVPITKELAGKNPKGLYINSKGLVEEVEGKIVYVGDEAFFVMTLNHLSTYAVVDGETADKAIEKSNATIKAGVKATKITKAKALVKKGKVTLTWKKTAGYKVDGYQILKSTKKTSGFKTVKTTKLQNQPLPRV